MANDLLRGRQNVVQLTNKSTGVVAGDVVILDSSFQGFITTASAGLTTDMIGVAIETIASGSIGRICFTGYVPAINLCSGSNYGDTFNTHSVAKYASPHSTITDGDFGEVLGTGTTPPAMLWGGLPKQAGGAYNANGWTTADAMTYASADAPTFTMTCAGNQTGTYSPGMRMKLTQTTDKFFIITGVGYSANTTLTVYGGTDYTLTSGTIVNPYYSVVKEPQGFPASPAKWTVITTNTSNQIQNSPSVSTWYNLGSISIAIPIGVWSVDYQVCAYDELGVAGAVDINTTLSTGNNTESDKELTTYGSSVSDIGGRFQMYRSKILSLAAKTPYYLNVKTGVTSAHIDEFNASSTCVIRAICAYL